MPCPSLEGVSELNSTIDGVSWATYLLTATELVPQDSRSLRTQWPSTRDPTKPQVPCPRTKKLTHVPKLGVSSTMNPPEIPMST